MYMIAVKLYSCGKGCHGEDTFNVGRGVQPIIFPPYVLMFLSTVVSFFLSTCRFLGVTYVLTGNEPALMAVSRALLHLAVLKY